MIPEKAKHTLKAIKVMTEDYGERPILICQIASQKSIPQKFLEAILLDLRNHGPLQSQEGKGGGISYGSSRIGQRSTYFYTTIN